MSWGWFLGRSVFWVEVGWEWLLGRSGLKGFVG